MRLFLGCLQVLFTVSILTAQSEDSKPHWFVGLGFGDLNEPAKTQSANIHSQKREDTIIGIQGGFQFSKRVAWTFGYSDYGSYNQRTDRVCPNNAEACIPEVGVVHDEDLDWASVESGLSFSWPLGSWVRFLGEANLASINTRQKQTRFDWEFSSPLPSESVTLADSNHKWGLKLTVGAEVQVYKGMGVTLGFSEFEVEGGVDVGFDHRASAVSLGTRYRF